MTVERTETEKKKEMKTEQGASKTDPAALQII